ncbi:MAG: filamentous hemagglutinin N-terminal domain-containing protein, partial [Deltaproteobacteria bacterium]|nr:filamentous hemagglutinin N-terminal domain-containing protein [Deltaproteobacteria bacterium]
MLLLCLATASLPASAEKRWQDPDNTTFGDDVSLDNSADGLLTEFMIDSNRTTIGWQDLQQPEDNTLRFSFTNPGDQPTVLNYIGAQHPSNLNGRVDCNGCTVVFSNPYGVYIGNRTVIETGNLVMVAGEIDRQEFLSKGFLDARLEGIVQNDGQILADGNVLLLGREVVNNGEIQVGTGVLLMLAGEAIHDLDWDAITDDFLDRTDFRATLSGGRVENNGMIEAHDAALIGARIINRGEITIADGSFLMLAADEVWIRRFDDPVAIRLPTFDGKQERTKQDVEYAIENHGRIDAGLGHVRLSAADPLGYGIRQGSGGSIAARKIELAGGEVGRVHLSGEISTRDDSPEGVGGEIDITGSIIALVDATVDASGTRGGGTIQIGGEQEGRGELQRARSVIIDDASEVRADALSEGDGGRVIVFSEEFTSVDGELSATGGDRGGDGGFIETSGLMRFAISETPDLSAPQGQAGDWLIDPFDITIRSAADVPACGVALECMNDEIEALLDPEFDDTAFDGIVRTIATSEIDAEVIAKALAVGTDVTLSTEAFGLVAAPDMGNITIASEIRIQNADTLASTTATVRLLAANHISVDADIVSEAAAPGEDPNLALDVILQANDLEQADPTASFSYDLIRGDVEINANIETGGGDLTVHGVAIHQAAGSSILTNGGDVDFRSGSLDSSGNPGTLTRSAGDPAIDSSVFDPASTTGYAPVAISIDGTVDTTDNTSLAGRGGNVTMSATGIDVLTPGSELDVVTGLLTIDSGAVIATGGGSMTLAGGQQPAIGDQDFAGNVLVAGTLNSSCVAGCSGDDADIGGAVSIDATHIDPLDDSGLVVQFIEADPSETPARREGGQIGIDVGSNTLQTGGATLSIGGLATRTISIDGMLDTRRMLGSNENGLTSIVAFDELAVDEDALSFGDGLITIGANAATTLSSGGISIQARTVETSDADPVFANAVVLEAVGASSTALGDAVEDVLQIEGRRSLDFGINTRLEGETVQIAAATRPAELSVAEQASTAAELQFQGITGAAVDGVRINASTVSITVGDGTTSTSDLASEPVDPMGVPFVRGSVGSYEGLQLASEDDTTRPDQITISQDGDLTIAATVTNGELSLESAFDTRAIGVNGMQLSLESADGVLTIEDATALNNTIPMAPVSPDDGKSWVTLLGGLLEVTSDPAVVFGSAGAPLSGAARFDVEALVVSTPGDFSVDSQIVDSILSVNDLAFEAGRNTGVEDTAESGDLTIGDAAATVMLRAGERLSLRAGASGFGDLTFSPGAGQSIELHADDIGLRAGAGAASLNPDAGDLSRIAGLAQPNIAIRRADGSDFGSDTPGSNLAFRYQQDAAIDAAIDLPPDFNQFGTGLTNGFGLARDVIYSVRSDMGSIDL